jgi:hypothetical protein
VKVRVLGLEEAFELASILSNHVDVQRLNPDTDALDFISDLLDKLAPLEYLRCVQILTHLTDEDVEKQISLNLLAAFIEGLKANQVISLLSFCKSIGF